MGKLEQCHFNAKQPWSILLYEQTDPHYICSVASVIVSILLKTINALEQRASE